MLHFPKTPSSYWFIQQGLFLAHGTYPCQVGLTLRTKLTEHPHMSFFFLTMYSHELVPYIFAATGSQKVEILPFATQEGEPSIVEWSDQWLSALKKSLIMPDKRSNICEETELRKLKIHLANWGNIFRDNPGWIAIYLPVLKFIFFQSWMQQMFIEHILHICDLPDTV